MPDYGEFADLVPKKQTGPYGEFADLVPKAKRNLPPAPDRQPKNVIEPFRPDVEAIMGAPALTGDVGSGDAAKKPSGADQGKSGNRPLTQRETADMARARRLATAGATGNVAAIARETGEMAKARFATKNLPPAPDRQPQNQPKPGRLKIGGKIDGMKDGLPNLAKFGSGDPGLMWEGAKGVARELLQGGADSAQQTAQAVADPTAQFIKRQLPNGLLRPDLEAELRKMGMNGKVTAETLKNLDPTQFPQFVADITKQADATGNTGVAQMGRGLQDMVLKIAEGDEDAAAQFMGMFNAFAISAAAGGLKSGLKAPKTVSRVLKAGEEAIAAERALASGADDTFRSFVDPKSAEVPKGRQTATQAKEAFATRQAKPKSLMEIAESTPVENKPAIEPKASPAETKPKPVAAKKSILAKEEPSPDTLPATDGRAIVWRDKTHTFPTKEHEDIFDLFDKEHRSEIARLEKEYEKAEGPLKRETYARLKGKRTDHARAKDEFFGDLANYDAKKVHAEMYQQFARMVGDDPKPQPVKSTPVPRTASEAKAALAERVTKPKTETKTFPPGTRVVSYEGREVALPKGMESEYDAVRAEGSRLIKQLGEELDEGKKKAIRREMAAALLKRDHIVQVLLGDETKMASSVRNRLRGGYTKLPVGDLRQLVNDVSALAGKAIRKGKTYAQWVTDWGKGVSNTAQSLLREGWKRARRFYSEGRSAAEAGQLQRGGSKLKRNPVKPLEKPAHLETGEDAKPTPRSAVRWTKAAFLNDAEGLDMAVNRLQKHLESEVQGPVQPGKKLPKPDIQYSHVDLRTAANSLARLNAKIGDYVFRGIRNAKGDRVSMGIPKMLEGVIKDGIDVRDWEGYLRAMRENSMVSRGGIDKERMKLNDDFIDRFLDRYGEKNVTKWDNEWLKLSNAHLDLYEHYGLKPKGWADNIREDNPFYFPLNPVATAEEVAMRQANPQGGVVSPMGNMKPAKGGDVYVDGFEQMARNLEHIIREGEKNQQLLPAFKEIAKHDELADVIAIYEKKRKPKTSGPTAEDWDELHGLLEEEVDPFEKIGSKPKEKVEAEGSHALVTLYDNGEPITYKIDTYIWQTLRGMSPQEYNVIQQAMRWGANAVRQGTTGRYAPQFGLLHNIFIDVIYGGLAHGVSPLRYMEGFANAAYSKLPKDTRLFKSKAGQSMVKRFGEQTKLYESAIENNLFFDNRYDFDTVRRMLDDKNSNLMDAALAKKGIKVWHSIGDIYDGVREAVEESGRLGQFAQQRKAAMKRGKGEALAERQASQMAADVFNFAESSALGRYFTQNTPVAYSNLVNQGLLASYRGIKRSPAKFVARGLTMLTVPAVWAYETYKNDPEYQRFENYVKDGSILFRDGVFRGKPHEGSWTAIRVPGDMGVLFMGIPRRALQARDSGKYTDEGVNQLAAMAGQITPSMIPNLIAGVVQTKVYLQSGTVIDARFGSMRGYPVKEDASDPSKGKANYRFLKQMADTMFGASARETVANVGWIASQGKPDDEKFEKKQPSLLMRYRPTPPPEKDKKRETAGEAKASYRRRSSARRRHR